MAYEVVATAEFNAHLDETVAYRANNYGLRSAKRLLDAVDKLCDYLADNPSMCRGVDDDSTDADSPRWMRADSYVAVYRVHEEHRQVALLKLLTASSNWRRRVLSDRQP